MSLSVAQTDITAGPGAEGRLLHAAPTSAACALSGNHS
jgi:hypothetical protein